MALIRCPECQHEVSTLATTCPGCGYPLKPVQQPQHMPDPEVAYLVEQERQREKRREKKQIIAVIYVVIMAIMIIIVLANAGKQTGSSIQYHTCTIGSASQGTDGHPQSGSFSSFVIPKETPCP